MGDVPSNTTASAQASSFDLGLLMQPTFLYAQFQVIFVALAIIWLGAHGSLRRPPSAAPPKPKADGKRQPKEDSFAEGFTASDAIMLPIMSGTVLIGLYYLIEWLQDPDILNQILRLYMSTVSVASLGRLAADALNILTSLVFPSTWADRKGRVYHIDDKRRCQLTLDDTGREIVAEGKTTPFPSFLSGLRLSDSSRHMAWELRHLLTEQWTFRVAAHGIFSLKFRLKFNTMLGVFMALSTSIAYHFTSWHVVSNLLGSALCYSAFSILSPTSFAIGTMVLWGLFFYDIVMVFYT